MAQRKICLLRIFCLIFHLTFWHSYLSHNFCPKLSLYFQKYWIAKINKIVFRVFCIHIVNSINLNGYKKDHIFISCDTLWITYYPKKTKFRLAGIFFLYYTTFLHVLSIEFYFYVFHDFLKMAHVQRKKIFFSSLKSDDMRSKLVFKGTKRSHISLNKSS